MKFFTLWLATQPDFLAAPKYNYKRTFTSTPGSAGRRSPGRTKSGSSLSGPAAAVKLKGSGSSLKGRKDALPRRLRSQRGKWEHTMCREIAGDGFWRDEDRVFAEGGNLVSKRISAQEGGKKRCTWISEGRGELLPHYLLHSLLIESPISFINGINKTHFSVGNEIVRVHLQ